MTRHRYKLEYEDFISLSTVLVEVEIGTSTTTQKHG